MEVGGKSERKRKEMRQKKGKKSGNEKTKRQKSEGRGRMAE